MTGRNQLRKAALGLPEVAEVKQDLATSYRVREREFVALDDAGTLMLRLDSTDRRLLTEQHPTARGGGADVVRIGLEDVDGQQLNHWVRRAWHAQAPRDLAATQAAGETAAAGEVGDLPRAIGRAATQALAGAGLTSLELVAARSSAELLALHGVGPRAVDVLRSELARRSLRLCDDDSASHER